MHSASHLHPSVIPILKLSEEERLHHILQPIWISYPAATKVMQRLEKLYLYPKRLRMPCLLIVSKPNNGKTMLLNKFLRAHPPSDNTEGDYIIVPVLLIQTPNKPDDGLLFDTILRKINAPLHQRPTSNQKYFQTLDLLPKTKTIILVLDEFHQAFAKRWKNHQYFLNAVKLLSNELQIPLVAAGTIEANFALSSDEQLRSRFEVMTLPKWELNDEYLSLLDAFETRLPLKRASHLSNDKLAAEILRRSDGAIGWIANVLELAATRAITEKKERITLEILKSLDWMAPSDWVIPPGVGPQNV